MNKILRYTLFVLFCTFSVSCTVLKKSTKEKTDSHVKAESDSSSVTLSKIDTKITEVIDTVVKIPGSKITGELTADSELPFILENDDLKVIVHKGKINAESKPKSLPVFINKVTEHKATVHATVKEKEKTDSKVEKKNKSSEVKRTGFAAIPGWAWFLLILVAVVLLIWKFRKKLVGL